MRGALAVPAVSLAFVVVAGSGWATARGVPTSAAARYAARTYVEVGTGRETFMPIANERRVVTADDGSTITAVAAVGRHTADGLGRIVLLFHGPRFLGWASAYETFSLNLRDRGNA